MRSPKRAGGGAPKVPKGGRIARYPNIPFGLHKVVMITAGVNRLRTSRKVVSWESVCDCFVVGFAAEIDWNGGVIPLDSVATECYLWEELTDGIPGDTRRTCTRKRTDAAGGQCCILTPANLGSKTAWCPWCPECTGIGPKRWGK
jgi:hypothetical protein